MDKDKFFEELWIAVDQNFEIIDEYEDFEDIDFNYIGLINNTPGDLEDNVKEILVQSGRRFALGQK